jgi:hypothetical protein
MEDAMARGCWTAVLIVVVIIIGLALVVGPTIYREGRAVAGPVVEMARSENALEALDAEFPFTPPSGDAAVTEARLLDFLAVRRELQPLYAAWQDTVEEVEREHGESWVGAKVVLAATRDTMTGQIAALRDVRMSPSEFLWLEEVVYRRWRNPQDDAEDRARRQVVRELTEEDLEMVAGLERRHGSSPALRELRSRLDDRLATAADDGPAPTPGISPATQELLWRYRDEIDGLDLAGYELHPTLDRRGGTTITIGDHRPHSDD